MNWKDLFNSFFLDFFNPLMIGIAFGIIFQAFEIAIIPRTIIILAIELMYFYAVSKIQHFAFKDDKEIFNSVDVEFTCIEENEQ